MPEASSLRAHHLAPPRVTLPCLSLISSHSEIGPTKDGEVAPKVKTKSDVSFYSLLMFAHRFREFIAKFL